MMYDYFSKVRVKLEEISWIIVKQKVNFEIVSNNLGIISGKIVFLDNSVLEIMELVSEKEVEYRFHYMDKNKKLIYRWDSAPHHRVASFPFHLHAKDKIEESKKMNLIEVLDIILDKVIDNLEKKF